jgi:sugar/nucleoside kinase (ribokinase family)
MIPLDARPWDVVCVGDPCVDLVFDVESLPAHASKALGRARPPEAGGTTANVACVLSALGHRVTVLGAIGNDDHGGICRDSFDWFGVDTTHLRRWSGAATASAVILVTPDKERTIVYCPMDVPPPADEAFDLALRNARAVYAMPYDLGRLERLSRAAERFGTRVAIDLERAVATDAKGLRARAALADITFFNEEAFRAAAGRAPDATALKEFFTGRTRAVVVTRAAAGAVGADATGFFVQPAFVPEGSIVDTIGAGDAFNAACLQAWLDGSRLPEAMRAGCAAASFVLATPGARSGLPDSRQLAALLARSPRHEDSARVST